ncbi:hypothetical protein [Polynucleobacter sp.]|uniref:hypothetical protein n=1 Tax=Polynucleobacter sp. TaxID=2029855 RepID=UPI003F69CEDD
MNIQELQLQKLRLEMAANAINLIVIAQRLVKDNPYDPECIALHSQAVEQYEGLMGKIVITHQHKLETA